MKRPRMFHGGKETWALRSLRAIKESPRPPHAQARRLKWKWQHPQHKVCQRMLSLGWIEVKRTGPRGGQRWHISDKGEAVLSLADTMGKDCEAAITVLFGEP